MRRMGVEEEYLLVDTTGKLKNAPGVVEEAAKELGEQAQTEIALNQVETATPICTSLAEAHTTLQRSRKVFQAAAALHGAHLLAAGTAALGGWETQEITPKERYLVLLERYRHLAEDQAIAGMHVHVEVSDLEEAVKICDRAKLALPILLALSTSSPYWEGRDTGYLSWRSMWFGRWPTAGASSPLGSAAAYEELIGELQRAGAIDDGSNLYWDIRPSVKYPTVEVRVMDVCTRLDESIALAGLSRGVAAWAAEGGGEVVPVEIAKSARWRAARDGVAEKLVDLDGNVRAAGAVVQNLLTQVRPHLGEDREDVEKIVHRILQEGSSGEKQRGAGSPEAATRRVLAEMEAGT